MFIPESLIGKIRLFVLSTVHV